MNNGLQYRRGASYDLVDAATMNGILTDADLIADEKVPQGLAVAFDNALDPTKYQPAASDAEFQGTLKHSYVKAKEDCVGPVVAGAAVGIVNAVVKDGQRLSVDATSPGTFIPVATGGVAIACQDGVVGQCIDIYVISK